jgi:hypothetical protein
MSQYDNPYSYQGNNILNMLDDEKLKKQLENNRLMEESINKATYDKGDTMLYNVHKNKGTMFGSVNPHTGMGVSPKYADAQANPSVPYGFSGSPMQDGSVVPKAIGVTPTVGNSTMSDAPKRNLDFNKYSKSMDKTFGMALLQSAIPKNDQTPARQAPSSGGRGGGNRMDQLTPYASAIKLDDEDYPGLWRYS